MKNIRNMMLLSILLLLFPAYVSASNACLPVKGTISTTETFSVSVGNDLFSSDKVVLTQEKGTTKQYWWASIKNFDVYGRFYVSVFDETSNTYVIEEDKWNDKTYTISGLKLKNNHSYSITVRGDKTRYVLDDFSCFPYVFSAWISDPTWSVTKTGDNIVFCSYTDSKTVIRGDVNGDGKVSIVDLSKLRTYLANNGNGSIVEGADVNGDGRINIVDLSQLRKMLAN